MHESELLRQSFSDYVGHLKHKHKQKSVASALSHPAFFLSIFYFKFEKQAADFKKSLFKKRAETKCVAIAPSPFSSLLLLFSRERREDLKQGKEKKRKKKRERAENGEEETSLRRIRTSARERGRQEDRRPEEKRLKRE